MTHNIDRYSPLQPACISDCSETGSLEQCFNRLAAVQQHGRQEQFARMHAALQELSEELTHFLGSRAQKNS